MSSSVPLGFKAFPLPIKHLSLPVVLKCGQSFRWQKVTLENAKSEAELDAEWRLALQDRVVCLRQTPETLYYRAIFPPERASFSQDEDGSTLAWLKDYFQLDIDLLKLFSAVEDPIFQSALQRFEGAIRMLRQDPWENLMSFICSQNNHISRISSMVQNLCTHFSAPLLSIPSTLEGCDPSSIPPSLLYHPFPPPSALADPSTEAKLRDLGFGYRAKYIQKTAAMLCESHEDPEKWLMSLRERSTEEAREELLKLAGVGPKVADCILLMSLDKHEVVPIDTHMLQIAIKHYHLRVPGYSSKSAPPMTPKLHTEVSAMLQKIWGPYAGWAHSVLFTADLKAFADHGALTPTSSTSTSTATASASVSEAETKVEVDVQGSRKRKRKADNLDASPSISFRQVKRSTLTTSKGVKKLSTLSRTIVKEEADGVKIEEETELWSETAVLSNDASLAERIKTRTRRKVVR